MSAPSGDEAGKSRFVLSIRSALFLAVLFAITPALAIIIWSGYEYGAHLKKHAIQDVLRQTEAFSEIQVRTTESARQILTTLAAIPDIQAGKSAAATKILKTVHAQNDYFLNFTLVDVNGTVTASSLLAPGTKVGNRPHVAAALRTQRFAVGQYAIGLIESAPSFAFSMPVLDDEGRLSGCVNAVFKLSSYAALFDQFSPPPETILGLVDRDGVRLYYYPAKDTNPVGKPIKASVWESIRKGGDEGFFYDRGSDDIDRYYGFKKLRLEPSQDPYLYVVYATPASVAVSASRAVLARNLILMLALGVFALGGSAVLFSKLFGDRLMRIIAAATALREGDLGARVSLNDHSPDLGRIGTAFDLMAEQIERRAAEREEYERRLAVALAEKEILLKEVHHRVKNNLQLVQSMVQLQDSDCDLTAFKESIGSRISAMALLHETLYRTENAGEVDLAAYAARIAELVLRGEEPRIALRIRSPEGPVFADLEKAVSFGLLVNELAMNALKHGFAGGRQGELHISVAQEEDLVRLEVSDDGPGLPPEFKIEESHGLGLRLAEALASQLGGELRWKNAGGALFFVDFSPRSGSRKD